MVLEPRTRNQSPKSCRGCEVKVASEALKVSAPRFLRVSMARKPRPAIALKDATYKGMSERLANAKVTISRQKASSLLL